MSQLLSGPPLPLLLVLPATVHPPWALPYSPARASRQPATAMMIQWASRRLLAHLLPPGKPHRLGLHCNLLSMPLLLLVHTLSSRLSSAPIGSACCEGGHSLAPTLMAGGCSLCVHAVAHLPYWPFLVKHWEYIQEGCPTHSWLQCVSGPPPVPGRSGFAQ